MGQDIAEMRRNEQSERSRAFGFCRRGVLTSNEEAQQELLLVSKIVQHLIRREGVLIVVESPTREPGEDDRTFAKRQQRERVLAVAPTYTDE